MQLPVSRASPQSHVCKISEEAALGLGLKNLSLTEYQCLKCDWVRIGKSTEFSSTHLTLLSTGCLARCSQAGNINTSIHGGVMVNEGHIYDSDELYFSFTLRLTISVSPSLLLWSHGKIRLANQTTVFIRDIFCLKIPLWVGCVCEISGRRHFEALYIKTQRLIESHCPKCDSVRTGFICKLVF